MATNGSQKGPLRVMLWSNPRTLSTIFLKCMSFVDGVQAINEPFAVARLYGPEKSLPSDPANAVMTQFNEQQAARLATVEMNLPKAFDDLVCTFQWAKDTLEADYSDKKLVFCKDQAFAIYGRFNMLPEGYRHTFLIRNPYKIFPSWKNVIVRGMPAEVRPFIKFDQLLEAMVKVKSGVGEQYDLLEYVKETIEPNPVVIDADDLSNHPASILRQYCEAIGIPFKESMLSWEGGDNVTLDWIASAGLLRSNKLESSAYYDEALKSTCFHPSKPARAREELSEDLLKCIDIAMPAYEKMYDMRLRP